MNKVIKDMAVINQLNELSVNDVKVRSSEISRLPANIKAKMTTKLYKNPFADLFWFVHHDPPFKIDGLVFLNVFCMFRK